MIGLINNKRGQEGITIGTLLLILLGAIVVVVIILGATGSFNFIFSKINVLPGQDLQAVVSACQVAGQNGLKADYCVTFKQVKIDGVKQYVNCQDARVQAGMTAEEKGKLTVTCDGDAAKAGMDYCKTLFAQGNVKTDTKVNNRDCSGLSCTSVFDGDLVEPSATCPTAKPKKITVGFAESSQNACCVTG